LHLLILLEAAGGQGCSPDGVAEGAPPPPPPSRVAGFFAGHETLGGGSHNSLKGQRCDASCDGEGKGAEASWP